jgi:threonine/homoserine/homoserine lactone efflux protein
VLEGTPDYPGLHRDDWEAVFVRVDPDGTVWTQVIVFGISFVLLGLMTDSAYALVAGSLGAWMRRRRRAFRYASGTVFVALGAATALAKRS